MIERLWKWTKKECLNCKYYDTFDEFKTAIDNMRYSKLNNTKINRNWRRC
ncbi:MAG: hypothetical protein LBG15_02585 [Dysgonamonadaceae bacterium]|nr:hypothetical protein [Dysgonamonadaceae bacterium]